MIFLKTLSVFMGTVIGAGIFGLPYVAQKAGFFVMVAYFLVLTPIIILIHLLYARVALGTERLYRLPGYVGEYLGNKWKNFTFFIIAIGLVGAILVYFIIGGTFLNSTFSFYFGEHLILWTFLFFVLGLYLILRDIKTISKIELFFLFFILVFFSFFLVKSLPLIDLNSFKSFDLKAISLPYGIILFSLGGTSVIPELEEMLANFYSKKTKNYDIVRKKLKKVIIFGLIASSLIYLLFIVLVLGTLGPNTPKDAVSGLLPALGPIIFRLGLFLGVMSCFTSFIALGLTFKKMLSYDFNFPPLFSWFIVCFLPLSLFLLGAKEFIKIIGLTGAISMGIEGAIIIFLYGAFLRKNNLPKINPLYYFLILIFILGVSSEIFFYF